MSAGWFHLSTSWIYWGTSRTNQDSHSGVWYVIQYKCTQYRVLQHSTATNYYNTVLQHSTTTQYYNTVPQHSTVTQYCNTVLQQITTTQYCNTVLQHTTTTNNYNTVLQHSATEVSSISFNKLNNLSPSVSVCLCLGISLSACRKDVQPEPSPRSVWSWDSTSSVWFVPLLLYLFTCASAACLGADFM